MGLIKQNSRLSHHKITTPGSIFTVPVSSDFTDGTWVKTDLNLGEIGINTIDDRIFFRSQNGIIEIETLSGLNALWKRDGEDIRALENALTSPLIYPDILPPIDGVSSLGNASYAWKDIHMSGKFTQGSRNGSAGLNSTILGGMVSGNEASGDNSFAIGDGSISNHYAEFSGSSCLNAQYGKISFARRTTNNTLTEIFLDGSFSASGSLRFIIGSHTAYKVRIYVNAFIDSGANAGSVAVFSGKGTIKNITSGGFNTVTVLNPITMTQDETDAAISTASVSVDADNTNKSLKIAVTGITSENIRWFVRVDYEKISY